MAVCCMAVGGIVRGISCVCACARAAWQRWVRVGEARVYVTVVADRVLLPECAGCVEDLKGWWLQTSAKRCKWESADHTGNTH
eukprot:867223-Pelagomonas_calceolata.AAC.11